jgi:hypothetical protein
MLKQILITSILLLGSTSQLSATKWVFAKNNTGIDEAFTNFNISVMASDLDNNNLLFSVDLNDSTILNAMISSSWENNTSYLVRIPLQSSIANKYGIV